MYPLSIIGNSIYHQMGHYQTRKRYARYHIMHQLKRVCIVCCLKAIFSNPDGLQMILNYIFKLINKLIKYKIEEKKKKTRYGDVIRTHNLYDSGHAIHPLCNELSV